MSHSVVRSPLPALRAVLALRVHWRAVASGAALTLLAFAGLLALALVSTSSYRASIAESAAAADVVLLVGAALVLSAALGGFATGLSSHTNALSAGGLQAAASSVTACVVIIVTAGGLAALHVAGADRLLSPSYASVAMALFVIGAVLASTVGGRYGARSNATDEAALQHTT